MELQRSCGWEHRCAGGSWAQNEGRGTRNDKTVERREKRDGHMRNPSISVMGGERDCRGDSQWILEQN